MPRRSGSYDRDADFTLHSDNTNPTGIATDGQTIWITDDRQDEMFVYTTAGELQARLKLDPQNADPAGITNDPAGGSDPWGVDSQDRLVYEYLAAGWLPSGELAASSTFTLHPDNQNPAGIIKIPLESLTLRNLATNRPSLPRDCSTTRVSAPAMA